MIYPVDIALSTFGTIYLCTYQWFAGEGAWATHRNLNGEAQVGGKLDSTAILESGEDLGSSPQGREFDSYRRLKGREIDIIKPENVIFPHGLLPNPPSWGKPLTGHEFPIALKINNMLINHVIFYQKMCLSNNLQKFCVSAPYRPTNFLFT